jgi:hypothetical protein
MSVSEFCAALAKHYRWPGHLSCRILQNIHQILQNTIEFDAVSGRQ